MTSSTRHPYRSAHARFNPRLPGGRRPHTEKPVPRARRSAGACRGARTDQYTRPRVSIHAFRGEGDPTPRSPYRARRSAGACRGARTDRRTSPHRRYAPAPPRTRQEPPRTRQEPARSPYRARAVRWRVSWRAHRPAYQPATALRASASRQTPPGTRQEPAASAYRALLRFSTITDPVRIRLRRPGIA